MHENLSSILKNFVIIIRKNVKERRATIRPNEDIFLKMIADKFQYTDEGVTAISLHGEHITKPSWFRASINLIETIKKSTEYNSTLKILEDNFGKENTTQFFDSFVNYLTSQLFDNPKLEDERIESFVEIFLKDLHHEPVKYGASVEIYGIVLRPNRLELSPDIILRQTKAEDIERELRPFVFEGPSPFPLPSAIMNIEFLGRGANKIQNKLQESIAILRLFKVGSVTWTRCHMYTDSITDIIARSTVTSGNAGIALETYLVSEEDVPKLKKFWETMVNIIPSNFLEFNPVKIDSITVAYNRYCDSLLQNHILERRITNAVMGLEALLLNEFQELPYRLSLRASKLLSLVMYDPVKTREIIRKGYRIRSTFVHGGSLKDEEKKKLESEYGSTKDFLHQLVEYLRVTIIITILVKRSKEEIIALTDDSLVDKEKEAVLSNTISPIKEVIG